MNNLTSIVRNTLLETQEHLVKLHEIHVQIGVPKMDDELNCIIGTILTEDKKLVTSVPLDQSETVDIVVGSKSGEWVDHIEAYSLNEFTRELLVDLCMKHLAAKA